MSPRSHPLIVSLLSLMVLAAGCSRDGHDVRRPSLTNPATQDEAVRPVRMTSGRALTYVLPETAGQILCQVVPKVRWEQLLNGPVGRHPRSHECTVTSAWASVDLRLWNFANRGFRAETTVGGRPAAPFAQGLAGFNVALTDDALAPHARGSPAAVLSINVTGRADIDLAAQRDLAKRIAEEVVPLLAKPGDPLPEFGQYGRIPYMRTPVVTGGEIFDLPRPVQALQLCTFIQEAPAFQVPSAQVEPTASGDCRIQGEGRKFDLAFAGASDSLSTYPDRIANRPARTVTVSKPELHVRLRDGAGVDLVVKEAPDPVRLAEAMVPLLLNP